MRAEVLRSDTRPHEIEYFARFRVNFGGREPPGVDRGALVYDRAGGGPAAPRSVPHFYIRGCETAATFVVRNSVLTRFPSWLFSFRLRFGDLLALRVSVFSIFSSAKRKDRSRRPDRHARFSASRLLPSASPLQRFTGKITLCSVKQNKSLKRS